MQYTMLGSTGLKVSVAGLGCGGNSRIGLGTGKSEAESIELVRAALDLGVTYFDTAALYGTEPILGRAFRPGERSKVVISTKAHIHSGDRRGTGVLPAANVVASLERSLRNLNTDYIDVFMLHGVAPAALDPTRSEIVATLLTEKAKGKLRHLGITETAARDADHAMLDRALEDPCWEVIMLAFHMMHEHPARGVSPNAGQGHRHADDVRRTQYLLQARSSRGNCAQTGGSRPNPSCAGCRTRSAQLPGARGRRREPDRRRLSLCASRAGR